MDSLALKRSGNILYHAIAVVFILSVSCYFETIERNFFNRDDNFSQFGPIIIGAGRSLFQHGIFPFWTPYQHMGGVVYQSGIYALTYPLTYLSYWIANYIFGEEEFWANIFFILHAIPGYFVTWHFLRGMDVSKSISTAAALSFIFIGYNIVAGSSWYYMLPVMVWLPAMFMGFIYRDRWSRRKWILVTGLSIGFFYHAGNVQMWVYAMLFWGIGWFLMFLTRWRCRVDVLLDSILAGLLTIAIALPLLWPQYYFLKDVFRPNGAQLGVPRYAYPNLILPYPWAIADFPTNWKGGRWGQFAGQLYYGNMILTPLALVAMALTPLYLFRSCRQLVKGTTLWLILGTLGFFAAIGPVGKLWIWMRYIPVFAKFSWPFKFLPFMHFFLLIAAAIFLSRLFKKLPNQISVNASHIFLGAMLALIFYTSAISMATFCHFADRTYKPFPGNLQAQLTKTQRSYTYTPWRSLLPNYVWTLPHNFTSVYEYFAVGGYDQFTSETPQMHIFYRWFSRHNHDIMREVGVSDLIFFDSPENIRIVHLGNAKPLVFFSDDGSPVRFDVDWQGISISRLRPGLITFNFVYQPGFEAYDQDGNTIPLKTDTVMRMQLEIDDKVKSARLNYTPPYLWPALGLSVLMLAGILWLVNLRRFGPNMHH